MSKLDALLEAALFLEQLDKGDPASSPAAIPNHTVVGNHLNIIESISRIENRFDESRKL